VVIDLGIPFFDNTDNYGLGLSGHIMGQALRGRYGIVVPTKFGDYPIFKWENTADHTNR